MGEKANVSSPKASHRPMMRKKRAMVGEGEEGGDLDLPLGNQMCKRLVDDWESVTKNNMLLKLPCKVV